MIANFLYIEKSYIPPYAHDRIIGATRKTGGSNWGYKPPLLTRASRRGVFTLFKPQCHCHFGRP